MTLPVPQPGPDFEARLVNWLQQLSEVDVLARTVNVTRPGDIITVMVNGKKKASLTWNGTALALVNLP